MSHDHDRAGRPRHFLLDWSRHLAGMFIGVAAIGPAQADEASLRMAHVAQAADGRGPSVATQTRLWMSVGERRMTVLLADTEAARVFNERLPLTLDMTDLNDNEKKVELARRLPATSIRPHTIRSGDLMLWGDDTVVVFYKSFESPYPYTRLGQVVEADDLARILGPGSVTIRFEARP